MESKFNVCSDLALSVCRFVYFRFTSRFKAAVLMCNLLHGIKMCNSLLTVELVGICVMNERLFINFTIFVLHLLIMKAVTLIKAVFSSMDFLSLCFLLCCLNSYVAVAKWLQTLNISSAVRQT